MDITYYILINRDEYAEVGTNWIALYVKNTEGICFDSFGFEHVTKEMHIKLDIKT